MPMHEILNLQSIDYPGTVGEMIAHRASVPVKYPGNREALRADMAEHCQCDPILVQDGELRNGGNRVMHAHARGWTEMAVTRDPHVSDDIGWEDAHYDHEVAPDYRVHPAYANPEDYEAGRVLDIEAG